MLTVVPNLAMRSIYQEGTSGLCDQSCHTHGHKMSLLGEGKVDILFNRQSASQLASCNWPANQPCDKISTCQALGWSDGGRRTGCLTTLGPSPGSQHSHWFPLGVTYLTKARQVTQMSSAAHYILLALLLRTFCSFVSTSPNHIFLHDM